MTSQLSATTRWDTSTTLDLMFVIDEIATLEPGHDTSVALMEAAQLRGHRVLITSASELGYEQDAVTARCRDVTLRPAVVHDGKWVADTEWFTIGEAHDYRVDDAHAVFMRTDPPVDAQYLRATYLLDLVDPRRTLLINSPEGLRGANEHLYALQTPDLGPPTVVTANRERIIDVVRSWRRAVLKPTEGMGGRGVLLLDADDPNLSSLVDSATERGAAQVVVQRWLPECAKGDRRVIVLDGVPIGAVRRIARDGEFRCNMAAGAAAVADTVTEIDREICAGLRPHLRSKGLTFVGIDVIGDKLTEVNVTSPTGIREIDALSGSQLARDVIAWVETNCPAMSGRRRP